MSPAPDAARDPAASSPSLRLAAPREIGPYRILRPIGEGGMGVVFLAQQERPSRTVALKVIHASVLSPRTLRRFEQEAEVLGRLHHPGIAQVYQVGTYATEQGVLPYIAMEYVEGERLDQWAARGRTLRERLELVARLAEAVEHAHSKGVVHRDLKPGNVLVTADGQPKVLDFGVARLVEDEDTRTTTMRTDVGALLGTLSYMSPEQAGGDSKGVDARSDVYSLGVVLYELVSGRLPYVLDRAALPEAVRVIREEEPSKLSTHDRSLRGDVETIARKALEKDKQRRYATAQALADDIRRHLADQPIHARAPSAAYQLSKFARRNKALVGGFVAVLVTLAGGAAVATRLYLLEREASGREREARVRAEEQEKLAEATTAFLVSLFGGISPNVAQGADTTLLERILDGARERLSTELAGQPAAEADVRATLGRAYAELGAYDDAEAELGRAVELYTELYGGEDPRTLHARRFAADVLVRRGDVRAAEAAQREMLARQERLAAAEDRGAEIEALKIKRDLGDSLMRQGRHRESEELLRGVLARERELGVDGDQLEATLFALAQALGFSGQDAEAREILDALFVERTRRLGADHPGTINALAMLGSSLSDVGEVEEAETALRDALERARRVFGPDNPQTFSLENNLSLVLEDAGKTVEAEELLRTCLEHRRATLGEGHAETLGTEMSLAWFLWRRGRAEEGGTLALDVVPRLQATLGDDHVTTSNARDLAGMYLASLGRFDEAAEQFAAVVRQSRAARDEADPALALQLYNWGATLQNAGQSAAAMEVLREVVDLLERHPELEGEQFVPAARNGLAKELDRAGKPAEADPLFERALADRRKRHGAAHPEIVHSLSDYGETLLERGDAEAALPLLEELVQMQEDLPHEKEDWRTPATHMLYGRCLAALGRFEEAEAMLVPACEAFERLPRALGSAAREARRGILELYAAWDAAEPGKGIAERAERWRAPFPAE